MNAYEINKFLGAILGALVFVMGLSVLSEIIFTEEPPEEPGWQIAVAEDEDEAEEEEVVEEEVPFEVLLASADPAAGEAGSRVCAACHSFDEGGANGIGPALWNVVGREIAAVEGFNYSAALTAHGEEVGDWNYQQLDGFLENPQGWVPGTSMGYAGIQDREDRADVIAYLMSVSPDAPALDVPEDVAVAPEGEEVTAADEVDVAAVGDATTAVETDAAPAAETDAATEVEAEAGTGEPSADEAAEMEAVAEEATDDAAAGGVDPFTQLVASADPAAGNAAAAVCKACHTVEAGAPHRLGPNLHGVFRRPVASAEGFGYSQAMQNYADTHDAWTIDQLDTYLEAPMEVVPGTSMAYAGVKDEEERAAIIAWLHSISPDAGPIVQEAAAPATAEATDGAAPPEDTAPAQQDAAPAQDGDAQEDTAAVNPAAGGSATTNGDAGAGTVDSGETAAADNEPATADAAPEDATATGGDDTSALVPDAEPDASAMEEARELVTEDAHLADPAGRGDPEAGDEAVQNVVEAAVDEIAEGDVDAAADAVAEAAEPVIEDDEGAADAASLIDTDEADREGVADPVSTGAGTADTVEETEPAPEAAALDATSSAVVPRGTDASARERAVEAGVLPEEVLKRDGAGNDEDAAENNAASEAPDEQSSAPAAQEASGQTTAAASPEQATGTATRSDEVAAASGANERPATRVTINEATAANVEIVNPRPSAD